MLVETPYHVIPSFDVATVIIPEPTDIHRFPSHEIPDPPLLNILVLVETVVHDIPSVE